MGRVGLTFDTPANKRRFDSLSSQFNEKMGNHQPFERALVTVSENQAFAHYLLERRPKMHISEKDGGFYSPEELKELKEQFDRGTLPGETATDREARAAEILHRKQIHTSQT